MGYGMSSVAGSQLDDSVLCTWSVDGSKCSESAQVLVTAAPTAVVANLWHRCCSRLFIIERSERFTMTVL